MLWTDYMVILIYPRCEKSWRIQLNKISIVKLAKKRNSSYDNLIHIFVKLKYILWENLIIIMTNIKFCIIYEEAQATTTSISLYFLVVIKYEIKMEVNVR